jgi:hypothetical protein
LVNLKESVRRKERKESSREKKGRNESSREKKGESKDQEGKDEGVSESKGRNDEEVGKNKRRVSSVRTGHSMTLEWCLCNSNHDMIHSNQRHLPEESV